MSDEQMMQYQSFEEYIDAFSFRDSAEVYSNGIMLVPVFRVKQAIEYERRKKEMQQDNGTNDNIRLQCQGVVQDQEADSVD